MSNLESLDYSTCWNAMQRCGLPFSPTEAHAIAIGLLSAQVQDMPAQWQAAMCADLDPQDALAQACCAQLEQLLLAAQAQVADADFSLQLWLIETPEYPAVQGLRDWAQGFLFGFGLGGERAAAQLSAEGSEALHDLYEIAQLDVSDSQDNQDAQALLEVEEYLRVAAMLIYEDMYPLSSSTEVVREQE